MRAVWTFVILLSVIGITAAVARTHTVLTAPTRSPTTQFSQLDSVNSELVIQLQGWTKPEEHSAYFAFVHSFADTWSRNPGYALMHLIPGILMFVLLPLQFVRRIRDRHIAIHRWSGRTILALGVFILISAFFFGIASPTVPGTEPPIIGTIMLAFIYFGTRGFIAIRRQRVDEHRRWMIRLYAVVFAVSVVRLVALPLALFYRTPDQAPAALMTSFWLGWLLSLAGAEWFIRRRPLSAPYPVLEQPAQA